jgi:hypothetical protein
MAHLTQLLESLASALTVEQEQEALQLFDALSDAQLEELTSGQYVKSWLARSCGTCPWAGWCRTRRPCWCTCRT